MTWKSKKIPDPQEEKQEELKRHDEYLQETIGTIYSGT